MATNREFTHIGAQFVRCNLDCEITGENRGISTTMYEKYGIPLEESPRRAVYTCAHPEAQNQKYNKTARRICAVKEITLFESMSASQNTVKADKEE